MKIHIYVEEKERTSNIFILLYKHITKDLFSTPLAQSCIAFKYPLGLKF